MIRADRPRRRRQRVCSLRGLTGSPGPLMPCTRVPLGSRPLVLSIAPITVATGTAARAAYSTFIVGAKGISLGITSTAAQRLAVVFTRPRPTTWRSPHKNKTRRGVVGAAAPACAAPSRGLGKKFGGAVRGRNQILRLLPDINKHPPFQSSNGTGGNPAWPSPQSGGSGARAGRLSVKVHARSPWPTCVAEPGMAPSDRIAVTPT